MSQKTEEMQELRHRLITLRLGDLAAELTSATLARFPQEGLTTRLELEADIYQEHLLTLTTAYEYGARDSTLRLTDLLPLLRAE